MLTQTLAQKPFNRPDMLLNHGVLGAYPGNLLDGVPGVQYYGARVIASSYPNDVVQLHPDLEDRVLLDPILAHYERVGLQVANRFVFDESWEVARQFPHHKLNAFHFGATAHAVAPDDDFLQLAEELNDKNEFIKFCHVHGAPTPGTVMFNSTDTFKAGDMPQYPVYVKGAVSASGMHVFRCENDQELHAALAKMPGKFQIQEALPEGTLFCNIQYTEVAGQLHHGPLTLQKLVGNEHNGNIFPSGVDIDAVQPITDKLSNIIFRRGMKGTWAYDVAVTPEGRVYLIEMNPRWNGASYYSNPASHLQAQAWEGQYVHPRHNNFTFIFNGPRDWEYSPNHGAGIIIINWATVISRKLGLLVIGDEHQRSLLLKAFQRRFC